MHYFIRSTITLLLLFQLVICSSQTKIGVHPINVYLKYNATDSIIPNKLNIHLNLFFPYFESKDISIAFAKLKKEGVLKVDVSSLNFTIGDKDIFVSPEDTVEFTFSNNKLVLNGRNEKYLNYDYYRKSDFDSKNIPPYKKVNELSLIEYQAYCLNYFQKEQTYISNYFTDSHNELEDYLLNNSKYSLITNLYKAIEYKNYPNNSIPENYLKIFDTSLYNNPGIYFNYYYGTAVSNYNSFISNTYNDSVSSAQYYNLIESARNSFSVPVYDYLLMRYIRSISRWGNSSFNDVAAVINSELKSRHFDKITQTKLSNCYNEFKQLSKNIKYFGEAQLKNIDGRSLYLRDVIAKGKYTYIDFWASWCGACIPELSFLKAAEIKYPQIQFITLSIDENVNKWKTAFNKFKLIKSNSFLLKDGRKSSIATSYNIQAIPRFLFFDRVGNCISASDVRPSSHDFYKYINQLIN